MSTNQLELLQSQTSVKEAHNSNSSNEQLWTKTQITDTPFWIVGNTEKGYTGLMGNYAITPTLESENQVATYIDQHHWELILTLATIVFKQLSQEQQ